MGLSDASPWKLSAALFLRYGKLLAFASFVLAFKDELDQFQNAREYLGFVLLHILALAVSGFTPSNPITFAVVGDNVAALSWADKGKTSGQFSQLACLTTSWFGVVAPTAVGPFRHLAGEDMGCIDAISRDKPHSFPPDREIHLGALPAATPPRPRCRDVSRRVGSWQCVGSSSEERSFAGFLPFSLPSVPTVAGSGRAVARS